MTEELNAKKLLKETSRRQFLKDLGLTAAAGGAAFVGSKLGLDYLADKSYEGLDEAEKQLREMALDIKSLIGTVDRKIAAETDKLEQSYKAGALDELVELGIATPAELKQVEEIIKNSREFEEYYSFAERAREFKDRIDRRLLSIDAKLEELQPQFVREVNDEIRRIFGMKSGQEGIEHRRNIRQRLDSLCRQYDTNDDDKTAQAAVLKQLNYWVDRADQLKLTQEERELYQLLKEKCEKGEGREVLTFIKNYNKNDVQKEALLRLRSHISQAEELYKHIRENTNYALRLQQLLKEGIQQVETIRGKKLEEYAQEKDKINSKITELKEAVNETIQELKQKGYDIETREDFINDTYLNKTLRQKMLEKTKPYTTIGAVALGIAAAATTFYNRLKTMKIRTARKALDEAVKRYNALNKGEENAS
ncbi:twin-arginine translocation signal domain-containing protein [Candidatus Woesearchaeota archaeon]|nr:twin-arginine translocation signal domain-containing protein [Candidatus Woesearchaeota archaeon]MBW3016397.1 twin-arginine translocation signal domain-containing protein [Candidatus Woesearchaeota archaeon]